MNPCMLFNMYPNTSTKKVITFEHNMHAMIDFMWGSFRDALGAVLHVWRRRCNERSNAWPLLRDL